MNKLELPGIMICEWDAETKCMIVSPAEGWKVNVNYPISEAHASLVTMEEMDGPDVIDLKNMTGMWVICTNESDGVRLYEKGKWYKIGSDYWLASFWDTLGASEVFDLTDPRDYNPDERKPHQLKEYDAVECNAKERAEIIRIADECGVGVFSATKSGSGMPRFKNLYFSRNLIVGIEWEKGHSDARSFCWHTVPDFIAKIRGEYTEVSYFQNGNSSIGDKVNVSEHKHPQL